MKSSKKLFEGDYLDLWETPKEKDGRSDIILSIGGTHLYLNSETVFSELQVAIDTVQRERNKPNEACYQ
jgi:hypothetical protein